MLSSLDVLRPALLLTTGLFGASGVGMAAAAAHMSGTINLLQPASFIALCHAPAVLALYLAHEKLPTATLCGLILSFGVLLFCGDLVMKQFTGASLFPMAAPIGGISLIIGWMTLTATLFLM
nr:DUF423 domain-containing protein [Allorhizobium sonneratiae]